MAAKNERVTYQPKPGDLVGAHRWPDHHAHPDCWGRPWQGTVLAVNDLRAWTGTLAFPGFDVPPSQADVDKHVAWCCEQWPGWDTAKVPVLWDFGGERKVYWETVGGEHGVKPYDEDVLAWERELWCERKALRRAA